MRHRFKVLGGVVTDTDLFVCDDHGLSPYVQLEDGEYEVVKVGRLFVWARTHRSKKWHRVVTPLPARSPCGTEIPAWSLVLHQDRPPAPETCQRCLKEEP